MSIWQKEKKSVKTSTKQEDSCAACVTANKLMIRKKHIDQDSNQLKTRQRLWIGHAQKNIFKQSINTCRDVQPHY